MVLEPRHYALSTEKCLSRVLDVCPGWAVNGRVPAIYVAVVYGAEV